MEFYYLLWMDSFRLTVIGIIVYTSIIFFLTVGHYRELQTGKIEGTFTKVGMIIGIMSIFVPVTGLPILIHTLLLFMSPEQVRGGIGILSIPISFALLILAALISFTIAEFVYTKVLQKTPHENWQQTTDANSYSNGH